MTIYRRGPFPAIPASNDAFADPPASILGSMTLDKLWDWTGATPLADWYVYDGSGNANGERSQPKAANAYAEDDATCMGSKRLTLLVRRETYFGLPLTGVQMEASGFTYGNGSPFYVEVRLKWTGYLGFWGGPWMFRYPGSPNEIDTMETINNKEPRWAIHTPNYGPSSFTASNVNGEWHRYGIRVDATTIKMYYETTPSSGVMTLVNTISNATDAATLRDSAMFPKMQHLCGGSYPESDNGGPIADGDLPTSDKFFYCDYIRYYN